MEEVENFDYDKEDKDIETRRDKQKRIIKALRLNEIHKINIEILRKKKAGILRERVNQYH